MNPKEKAAAPAETPAEPPTYPNGHFYSPIVDPADIAARADRIWPSMLECAGIDFGAERRVDTARCK